MRLKFIVSVSYNRFVFDDDCAALAFASIAKRTAEDENIRVEISIEKIEDEDKVYKEGEDE